MRSGHGASEDERRLMAGTAGKVLLTYIESLSPERVRRMRDQLARHGGRIEQTLFRKKKEPEVHGLVRLGGGYVYR